MITTGGEVAPTGGEVAPTGGEVAPTALRFFPIYVALLHNFRSPTDKTYLPSSVFLALQSQKPTYLPACLPRLRLADLPTYLPSFRVTPHRGTVNNLATDAWTREDNATCECASIMLKSGLARGAARSPRSSSVAQLPREPTYLPTNHNQRFARGLRPRATYLPSYVLRAACGRETYLPSSVF